MAVILLSCNRFHGRSGAQQCSNTSADGHTAVEQLGAHRVVDRCDRAQGGHPGQPAGDRRRHCWLLELHQYLDSRCS